MSTCVVDSRSSKITPSSPAGLYCSSRGGLRLGVQPVKTGETPAEWQATLTRSLCQGDLNHERGIRAGRPRTSPRSGYSATHETGQTGSASDAVASQQPRPIGNNWAEIPGDDSPSASPRQAANAVSADQPDRANEPLAPLYGVGQHRKAANPMASGSGDHQRARASVSTQSAGSLPSRRSRRFWAGRFPSGHVARHLLTKSAPRVRKSPSSAARVEAPAGPSRYRRVRYDEYLPSNSRIGSPHRGPPAFWPEHCFQRSVWDDNAEFALRTDSCSS
jgi:hypothetical protein